MTIFPQESRLVGIYGSELGYWSYRGKNEKDRHAISFIRYF